MDSYVVILVYSCRYISEHFFKQVNHAEMHCISLMYRTESQIMTAVKSVRPVTLQTEMLCMGAV